MVGIMLPVGICRGEAMVVLKKKATRKAIPRVKTHSLKNFNNSIHNNRIRMASP